MDTGIGYDVGLLQYVYPGITRLPDAIGDPFTSEVYAALSYRWVTGKVSVVVNDKAFTTSDAQGSWYAEINGNIPIDDFGFTKDTGITLNLHVGHQEFEGGSSTTPTASFLGCKNNSCLSYTDWKFGVTKSWSNGVNLGFYYTDTDAKKGLGQIYQVSF